jgi:flagellar assembly protein FliH
MSSIINSENSKNTEIQKYEFKNLNIKTNEQPFDSDLFSGVQSKAEQVVDKETEDKVIINNELLQKIDALTSQIVELQMELENNKKDYETTIQEQKQTLFENGKQEGIKEATISINEQSDELKNQLVNSITTLDEQKNLFDVKFQEIETDLIESAITIAKKVIKKELEQNSVTIAKNIASSLIAIVKDATSITLKVNKNDFTELSEHFNQDSINIMADDAVSQGGVIILNNNGNIDATITTRLNQALDLIGKE